MELERWNREFCFSTKRPTWSRACKILGPACTLLCFLLIFSLTRSRPAAGAPDRPEGVGGAGVSGIQVVNADDSLPAAISVDLHPQQGGPPVTILRSGVAPGAIADFYLPALSGLRQGAFAAVIRSDRPISALARTEWASGGGAFANEPAPAAKELVLPMLYKEHFGKNTLISIQNADAGAAAFVRIMVMSSESGETVADLSLTVSPGTSVTRDVGSHSFFAALPTEFQGWMRLSADRPIAVSAILDQEGARGVSDITAVPSKLQSTRLVAPLLYNAWGGSERTSAVSVLNPGTKPVTVGLRYTGVDGSCLGTAPFQGPASILPGRSQLFYQADRDVNGSGPSGLSEGCAASGLFEADGEILANVMLASVKLGTTAMVRVQSAEEASRSLILPQVRREHLDSAKLSTELQVSNPGNMETELELKIFDSGGAPMLCGLRCRKQVPAGGAARWDLRVLDALPRGSFGSARIDSSQAVLALVLDSSDTGTVDDSMYLGLAPDPESPNRSLLPIVLNTAQDLGPTPDPRPSPIKSPQPTSAPTPARPRISNFRIAGNSEYIIKNLSQSQAVDLDVDHMPLRSGQPRASLSRSGLAPGGTVESHLPSLRNLSQGLYSARISPDGGFLAALVRSDWEGTGGASTYAPPRAAEEVILPELYQDYAGLASMVALQNGDPDEAAMVSIAIYSYSGEAAMPRPVRMRLPPGGADLYWIYGRNDLPAGFRGWARVTADRPVSALVFTDDLRRPGITSLPGLAIDELAETLSLPLIFRDFGQLADDPALNALESRLQILNPNDRELEVDLQIRGNEGAELSAECRDFRLEEDAIRIGAGQHWALDLDATLMPHACVASARLTARGGPIAASIQVLEPQGGHFETFPARAIPVDGSAPADSNWHYALPKTRKMHTSARLSTAIQIQNLGDAPASVRLQAFDYTGLQLICRAACELELPAGAAQLWRPEMVSAIQNGSYGSVSVLSDQPLDVLALDVSSNGSGDIAGYRGQDPAHRYATGMPLLLRQSSMQDFAVLPPGSLFLPWLGGPN